jgi:hypothetical protein
LRMMGEGGGDRLLEPPLDVNDTLIVVPVGELTEDVSAQVDVAGTGVARRASVSDHTLVIRSAMSQNESGRGGDDSPQSGHRCWCS